MASENVKKIINAQRNDDNAELNPAGQLLCRIGLVMMALYHFSRMLQTPNTVSAGLGLYSLMHAIWPHRKEVALAVSVCGAVGMELAFFCLGKEQSQAHGINQQLQPAGSAVP